MIASLTLLAIFAVAAWWYLRENWDEVAHLRLVNPVWLIPMISGFVSGFVLQAVVTQRMLRIFSIHMPFRESVQLSNATTLLNFILPAQGGMGLRAVYLVTVYKCPMTDFLSMAAAFAFISIFVNTALGFGAMLLILYAGGPFNAMIGCAMAAILLAIGGMVIVVPILNSRWSIRSPRLARLLGGWNMVVEAKSELRVMVYATLGQSLIAALGYYAAFSAFDLPSDVPGSFALLAATTIGGLFNFTPGALGFQELAGMYFSSILPTGPTETLVVLSAYKFVWIIVAIVFGLPGMLTLRWRTSQASKPDTMH